MTASAPTRYFPAPRIARFCSQCGSSIRRGIPKDDNRERDICDHCGAIHYQNPRVVVGTLPRWQGKILLCRRAIEPRYDTWTLPAGFMELNESTVQGAERETLEESGACVQIGPLYTMVDLPHIGQVHIFYLAEASDSKLDPGQESLDARYFDLADIPWNELSFHSVSSTLRHYVEDSKRGVFPVRQYALKTPL
ncbi:NUDIX hydrolase [Bordetella sp. FB-8]|uniref:NUDIX hydrolase n=1 Tax=Bordetella sp. FB-8 TaxID=1159870 RepID=UPI00036F84C9|nr:NUDIX hydrolase [Bordetella sp. FB-8]